MCGGAGGSGVADKARVHAVESLRDLKPALVSFAEDVAVALTSAEADATRAAMRLRSERLPYWKKEVRVREEALTRAKTEMSMKKIMRDGEDRTSVDDRKAVDKAKARVEEARAKLETTMRWVRELDKEATRFSGQVQPLKSFVAAEMPRAIAELERLTGALEAYVAIGAKPAPRAARAEGGEA